MAVDQRIAADVDDARRARLDAAPGAVGPVAAAATLWQSPTFVVDEGSPLWARYVLASQTVPGGGDTCRLQLHNADDGAAIATNTISPVGAGAFDGGVSMTVPGNGLRRVFFRVVAIGGAGQYSATITAVKLMRRGAGGEQYV